MRFLLLLFIILLIPMQLFAAPLIVDGPGDGDGNGTDDCDTVREALIALGPAGTNSVSDEIHIKVDAINGPVGYEEGGAGMEMHRRASVGRPAGRPSCPHPHPLSQCWERGKKASVF